MIQRTRSSQPLREHATRSWRFWVLCTLVSLPLSKTTHAQEHSAAPTNTESQEAAAESPSDEPARPSSTQTADDLATPSPSDDRDGEDGDTEEPPTHLPHVFFDNRLNPIDYLGRELELVGEDEEMLAPKSNDVLLREAADGNYTLRRRYALVTHRTTKISHQNRLHELDDEVRQTLDVSIQFHQDSTQSEQLRVIVRHADPAYPNASSPLNVRVPSSGLALDCVQREFEVRCVRADTRAPIAWPQWATLDMSDWFSRRPLAPGDRWRRTLSNPEILGWSDGANGRMHSALQITESGPASGEHTTHIQGTLEGKGELKVYHRMESMPIEGQVDIEFDHGANMVRHLVWQWDGTLTSDGLLGGHRYQWERRAATILRVNTTRAED